MNIHLLQGSYWATRKTYRSKNGQFVFLFDFTQQSNEVEIYCHKPPSLRGRDSDPRKTHLFRSGKICFVSGRAPRTQARAEQLAGQWAEYFLNYIKTGEVAS